MQGFTLLSIFSCLLLLAGRCSSHPLCTNLRAPFSRRKPLAFCQYNGQVCCSNRQERRLQNQFKAITASDTCAPLLKSILCSRCDPFSAELYRTESLPRAAPVLCNSSVSASSTQSLLTGAFCSKVWDECQNLSVSNTPFASQKHTSSSSISDLWPSKNAFCNDFGGASDSGSVCFDGRPVQFNSSKNSSPTPSGVCLEKIGNGSYLNMVPHPDGSNRVFLSDQPGRIYLATLPEHGSGEALEIDESSPFLDLTEEVHFDGEFGLLGIAFHKNFQHSGRFFVSFNCDKVKWPECSGICSCNSEVGCDPSKLVPDSGGSPCQYHSVISEFTANGTNVKPVEVRRIFTMGLPYASHHAGQILFGPNDGYLYFMMGDGEGRGDPHNFAQNKKSLLGKIMRFDVDNFPDARTSGYLRPWGNYSVPSDNPFAQDNETQPEIWASGFRNPWRCSFDSERSSYLLCADVGEDHYEEVDIVTKGGNYGWNFYEGPFTSNARNSSVNDAKTTPKNPVFPIMWYNHSEGSSSSITGGYFYRSKTDPCLYGRYLYADLFSGAIWAGTETPDGSGNFTTAQIPVSCVKDSPIPCVTGGPRASSPDLGFVFSFGQDNRRDIYVMASSGLYRIVPPSRCNYSCPKENVTFLTPPAQSPGSSGGGQFWSIRVDRKICFCLIFGLVLESFVL